jgi:transposase InsO family protein
MMREALPLYDRLQEELVAAIRESCAQTTGFVEEYNALRPHSSLGMRTPAAFYERLKAAANES